MIGNRTCTIILDPMQDGGFLVHVAGLPEIVTCGASEDEALAMAREAIEMVLESRLERGEVIPEETTTPRIHLGTCPHAT